MVNQKLPKATKGFTLIELMLATSLLMLVMFSGYYAYSLYTNKWQKRVQTFWQGSERAMALSEVNRMLIAMNSYVVTGKNNRACIYFVGSSSRLRFVTDSPIYGSGSALVELELQSIGDTYQLTYKERSLINNPLLKLPQIEDSINWHKQSILMSGILEFEWSYFGWTSFNEAAVQLNFNENAINTDTRQWYEKHDANLIRVLPLNIQLKVVSIGKTKEDSIESNVLIRLPNNTLFKLLADIRVDA